MAGEREVHVETDEARGGSTPHVVRWVLGISLLAAIVLLSAIWIFGAARQGNDESDAPAAVGAVGQDIDGMVIDNTDELGATIDDLTDIPNQRAPEGAGTPPAQ